MDKVDLWSDFLVDDSAALDDATMPLIDLTSNESTDLDITDSNESNPSTHLLAHNSYEDINFQNNWVSSSTININQEPDRLQQSRIEANQSHIMYLNANNHHQSFNIPSSSTTSNILANPSRKRKLPDFSSQLSATGSSSCIIANTNSNTLNQFSPQLGFDATSGNVENSQRNHRTRISPPSPVQWASVSNNVQPNTSMPINQPVTAAPLIQNVCPSTINVAPNSRTSHSFSRYNATRLRSNIQGINGNVLSLNPPPHYQLIPQVNNDSSTTEQNFGFVSGLSNNVLAQRAAIVHDSNNRSVQNLAILHAIQQEMARNYSVSRAARDGQNRISSESMLSFDRTRYHRRVIDLHDRHRDMRLDVDNMSYEELLALGERIGNVNIGLSEEKIIKCLKQLKYFSPTDGALDEVESCCICREEYRQGENMGRLDCKHDFHANCIKKWLMIKNSCPICKITGLIT